MIRSIIVTAAILPLTFTHVYGQPTDRSWSRYASFWTTAEGHSSTVVLRNTNLRDTIVVTPVLWLSAGNHQELSPISLAPAASAQVDLAQSLRPLGLRGQAGSAEFRYSHPGGGALLAEITVEKASTGVAYTIPTAEYVGSSRRLFAPFLIPSVGAEIYIAAQNVSSAPITVTPVIETSEGIARPGPLTIAPRSFQFIELPAREVLQGRPSTRNPAAGRISLEHAGPYGALNAVAWIEDERTGFSSTLSFSDPARSYSNALYGTQILSELPLRASARPLYSFLVLTNTTPSTVSVDGAFHLETSSGPVSVPLGVSSLSAGAVVSISLGDIAPGLNRIRAGAVQLTHGGPQGALAGRLYSFTEDAEYTLYSMLDPAAYWYFRGLHWSTERGADTLLTVTNFGAVADTVKVELYHRGGSVELPPIFLQSNASQTLSIRDFLRELRLPPADSYGGFRVLGRDSASSKILVKEQIVDIAARAALALYGTPNHVTTYFLSPTSITVSASEVGSGTTSSVSGYAVWTDSYQEARCDTMFTGSTTTATVSPGSVCSRTVTGQSSGNTTLFAQIYAPGSSGSSELFEAQAQITVKGVVRISLTSVSPSSIHVNPANGPTNTTATVQVFASANVPAGSWVRVAIGKNQSTPSTLNFQSGLPDSIQNNVTIGGSTNFTFNNVGTANQTGSLEIQADITQKSSNDFDIVPPNPIGSGRASITVVN